MFYRDPKCVYVGNDFGQANVVAGWLQGQGIPAEVMNQATMGGLISPALTGATGMEVWVVDAAQAPEAIRLLGDHMVSQITRDQRGPPLFVTCEECGKTSNFPAKQRGSVQECPHCTAYLDVEDLDAGDESDDAGASQGSEEEPRTDGITDRGGWGLTTP